VLTEVESKERIEATGIPVVEARLATSRREAMLAARELGFPVSAPVFPSRSWRSYDTPSCGPCPASGAVVHSSAAVRTLGRTGNHSTGNHSTVSDEEAHYAEGMVEREFHSLAYWQRVLQGKAGMDMMWFRRKRLSHCGSPWSICTGTLSVLPAEKGIGNLGGGQAVAHCFCNYIVSWRNIWCYGGMRLILGHV
jgi:hypothetical protein